jgi:hypothetical protein
MVVVKANVSAAPAHPASHHETLATVLLVIAACSSTPASVPPPAPIVVPDGCDPIAPQHCGFPFPNDFWRDSTGHVVFGPTTFPMPAVGKPLDPTILSWRDGFSAGEEADAYLPNATATGLPDENNIAVTATTASATILLEPDTGTLMPHFSEIDMSTPYPDQRALMIHPVMRLKDGTRYIVAIRNVVDSSGVLIPPSASFQALRDKIPTQYAALEARRAHFEDIFTQLTAAGIARSTLQIAWDYTTATQPTFTSDLLSMRDQALAVVGAQGPSFTITQIEINPNQWLAKRLHGMMTVPLYLNRPDAADNEQIFRDASGSPAQNGTAQYEFVVLIPPSATDATPAPIIQNGHGLLGTLDEGTDGYFAQFCGQYNYVGVAVDWIGMAADDNTTLVDAITEDMSIFENVVDRQHQGFVNALLAMRMMMGGMGSDPNLQMNGKSILDPTQRFYRGDSQGGIFGTTYMSITTDVTRGLLGEPGMPYTLLLDRSADFSGFKLLLGGTFHNGLDQRLAQAYMQLVWDRTEPDGYAEMLAPNHRVIIDTAIGDHQVTTLGAHVIARTIGAQNLSPVNREVWGITDTTGPVTTGSAMSEYDFGLPPVPTINIPPTDGNDPHGLVRTLPSAMSQADEFFRNGDIKQFCTGPCSGPDD